jgi:hypothetical protein
MKINRPAVHPLAVLALAACAHSCRLKTLASLPGRAGWCRQNRKRARILQVRDYRRIQSNLAQVEIFPINSDSSLGTIDQERFPYLART